MQWTVVSSAYKERLPDITACGISENHVLLIFIYYINTIGLYCYERSNLLMNEKQKEKKKKKKESTIRESKVVKIVGESTQNEKQAYCGSRSYFWKRQNFLWIVWIIH